MDSSRINALKWVFMQKAAEVCPGFCVTDDNRAVIADIFNWCLMLPGKYDPHKGLCLLGNVGTGKTTLLRIVKAFGRLVRPMEDGFPYSFRISNASEVCAAYAKDGYEGVQTYIDSDRQAFDELGAETIPTGHYGTSENVMQYLLQRRYDRRFTAFTHVTTNLTTGQLRAAYGDRVYDRCRELFNFVELRGRSFRR